MATQGCKQTKRALLSTILLSAALISAALAQSGPAVAQLTMPPAEMLRILSQPSADFADREKSAPAPVKDLLATLRSQIEKEGAKFTVGYTTALDVPLNMLAGTLVPREPNVAPAVNERAGVLLGLDLESAKQANVAIKVGPAPECSPQASHFDWRTHNKVTPVRSQICGTCWDFAAMGAYEGSYALRNNQLVDTSEQYILNCAHAGSCAGGWWMPVFDFLMSHGDATAAADPFTGNDKQQCPANMATPYRASAWAFVGSSQWTIPAVAAIKQALCTHGPLATAVYVDPPFQAYTGGTFDEHTHQFNGINHGIVIIGWDDTAKAWLIKNSWGVGWGGTGGFGTSKGFMWIAYDTNNVGIATAWVDATNNRYKLIAGWEQRLQQFKIEAPPLPKP